MGCCCCIYLFIWHFWVSPHEPQKASSQLQTECSIWTEHSTGHNSLSSDLLLTPLYHHIHPSYLSVISTHEGDLHCRTDTTPLSGQRKSLRTLAAVCTDKWVRQVVLKYAVCILKLLEFRTFALTSRKVKCPSCIFIFFYSVSAFFTTV